MSDFWLNDILIFFRNDNYLKILPDKSMSYNEKLNSFTLFCFYLFIILIFIDDDSTYFMIPLILIFFTIILYYIYIDKQIKQIKQTKEIKKINNEMKINVGNYDFDGNLYFNPYDNNEINADEYEIETPIKMPSASNPYMNPNHMEDDNNLVAHNADDKDIKEKINNYANEDLFMNLSDLYDKKNSQRLFYSVSNAFDVNGRNNFVKWVYDKPIEEKHNNINNIDLRYMR